MIVLFLSISNRLGGVENSLATLTGRLEPIFNQYYQPFKKVAEEKGYENTALLPVNLVYTDVPIDHPPQSELKGKTDNLDYAVHTLPCKVTLPRTVSTWMAVPLTPSLVMRASLVFVVIQASSVAARAGVI